MASIDNCTTYHYCIDGLRPRWRLVKGISCGFNYNLIHRFSIRDILVNDRNTLLKRVGVEMSEYVAYVVKIGNGYLAKDHNASILSESKYKITFHARDAFWFSKEYVFDTAK